MGLYQQVLGAAWRDLDPALRRFHAGSGVRARGSFQVVHGAGKVARKLARVLDFPPESEAALLVLEVTAAGGGERWWRKFGEHEFITTQRAAAGMLAERRGALEFFFHLSVQDGALAYQQVRARLHVGAWSVRLPNSVAPWVAARESAAAGRVEADVRLCAPAVGLLLRYSGWIALEES
jgi:hypothetical protein